VIRVENVLCTWNGKIIKGHAREPRVSLALLVPPLDRISNVLRIGTEVQRKFIDESGGTNWGKGREVIEDVF
jgi:hypothetical protein